MEPPFRAFRCNRICAAAACLGDSRGSVLAARFLSLLSALRVRFEDASVCGVLDTDWLWLLRTAPSLWLSREFPETALTRDCGRCWEVMDEAVGGGMGEGSRRLLLLLVLENEGCVCELADSGLRKGAVAVVPLSLFLRSPTGLLVIAGWLEGPPRRQGGAVSASQTSREGRKQDVGTAWRRASDSGDDYVGAK